MELSLFAGLPLGLPTGLGTGGPAVRGEPIGIKLAFSLQTKSFLTRGALAFATADPLTRGALGVFIFADRSAIRLITCKGVQVSILSILDPLTGTQIITVRLSDP